MTAELWLVRPCKHGKRGEHGGRWNYDEEYCPGEYRVRLDTDKVVFLPPGMNEAYSIQDIITALDQEETP